MADCKKYNGSTWQHSLRKLDTSTDILTTLPADIYANDTTATVGLKGQAVQSSTPTPDNPIMPQGTGERTGNLWQNLPNRTAAGVDISSENGVIHFTNTATSSYNVEYSIGLPAGTYTIKANANRIPANDENACIQVYNGSTQLYTKVSNNAAINGAATFTINQNLTVSLRIRLQNGVDYTGFELRPTLNSGSTAMDFEPYGYKIPISSASTTTPVYLGEVETTRRVKKLVLTGEETISGDSAYNRFLFTIPDMRSEGVRLTKLFCTHYQNIADGRPISNVPNNSIYTGGGADGQKVFIKTIDYTTVADFKAYLAQQYAAGTPVTVWYVLATEETAVVNEPLMRIGDYADAVSNVSIPVTAGECTLSVDTTVQPSEVTVNYEGWHPAIVHERTNGAWT